MKPISIALPTLAALAFGCAQGPTVPATPGTSPVTAAAPAASYELLRTNDRGGGGGGRANVNRNNTPNRTNVNRNDNRRDDHNRRGGGGGGGRWRGRSWHGHGHAFHNYNSWWGGDNWWGTFGLRSWWGLGYQPAWWGTLGLTSNRLLFLNGYYYPYYAYGATYFPSYAQPYVRINGLYMPVTGNMPTPPNNGGTISAYGAQVVTANDSQIQD